LRPMPDMIGKYRQSQVIPAQAGTHPPADVGAPPPAA
jgi:hypothetical protein